MRVINHFYVPHSILLLSLECVYKANKILIDTPYDTAIIKVQNSAQTSSNVKSSQVKSPLFI